MTIIKWYHIISESSVLKILIWNYLNRITFWARLFIRFASFLFVASCRKAWTWKWKYVIVRPDDPTSTRMLPVAQTKCPLFRFFLLLLRLWRYNGKAGKGTPMQNLANWIYHARRPTLLTTFPPNMSVRTLRPLPAFCSFSSSCWMTSWKAAGSMHNCHGSFHMPTSRLKVNQLGPKEALYGSNLICLLVCIMYSYII